MVSLVPGITKHRGQDGREAGRMPDTKTKQDSKARAAPPGLGEGPWARQESERAMDPARLQGARAVGRGSES